MITREVAAYWDGSPPIDSILAVRQVSMACFVRTREAFTEWRKGKDGGKKG